MKSSRINRGSILIELCIAIALFSIVVGGVAAGSLYSSADMTGIEHYRHALYKTLQIIEEESPGYIVEYISPCRKNISAKTVWRTGARERSAFLSTIRTDVDHTKKVGGDCDGIYSTTSDQVLLSTHVHTQSAVLDILNKKSYAAVSSTSSHSFLIMDENQGHISSIDFTDPIADIDAIGDTVFTAVSTSTHQLTIIDIADPKSPVIIAKQSLPTITGSFPGGRSLMYYDNKLYIGTHRTAGREFQIFDVTNRGSPQWLGYLEVNHNINHIIVNGSYAYLGTSGNIKDVIILDISNPQNIKIVSMVELPGSEDTQTIYLLGSTLFVGRTKAKSMANPEFIMVDVADPLSPKILGSLSIGETIISIKARGPRVYALLNTNPSKILRIDAASSTKPFIQSTQLLGQKIFNLDYEENILYGI
ncbi:MAG: beta-propeller domain-containing protein [bacterium]|nr:beta-propeller domain-containing protein [bacterium]